MAKLKVNLSAGRGAKGLGSGPTCHTGSGYGGTTVPYEGHGSNKPPASLKPTAAYATMVKQSAQGAGAQKHSNDR